jgi:hypothetical protein
LKELRNVGKVNSNRSLRISCLVRMQMLFEGVSGRRPGEAHSHSGLSFFQK